MFSLRLFLLLPALWSGIVLFFQIIGFYDAAGLLLRWTLFGLLLRYIALFPWRRFFFRFELRLTAHRADELLEARGRIEAAASFIKKGREKEDLEALHLESVSKGLKKLPGIKLLFSRRLLLTALIGCLLCVGQLVVFGRDVKQSLELFFASGQSEPIHFKVFYPQRVDAGSGVSIRICSAAARVEVEFEHDGEQYRREAAAAGEGFSASVERVERALRFRLHLRKPGRKMSSSWYRIKVLSLLVVSSVRFRIRYPAYMSRKDSNFQDVTSFRLPSGSGIFIKGKSSAPLKSCLLAGTSVNVRCRVDGARFTAFLRIRSPLTFRFRIKSCYAIVQRPTNPILINHIALYIIKNNTP